MKLPVPSKSTAKAVSHNTIKYASLVPMAVAVVGSLCSSFHWQLNVEEQSTIAALLAMTAAYVMNATGYQPPADLPAADEAPSDGSTPSGLVVPGK